VTNRNLTVSFDTGVSRVWSLLFW